MEQLEYLDDESDFYGDEETQNQLTRRCKDIDIHGYWDNHWQLTNVIAIRNTPTKFESEMAGNQVPYNPWERLDNAKKLGETPSEFLRRVPPLTSHTDDGWIWVANPYAPRDKTPEGWNAEYIARMKQLLEDYLEKKNKLTNANPNMAPGTITRRLGPDRDRLKEEIFEGAKKANVTCGKWMLFPIAEITPQVWFQVVEAVSAGKLGIGAKVATVPKPGDNSCLICIYTKDFTDAVDVRRELETMANLNLVDRHDSRGIYYKSDAYTYLDIYSNNPYGLKASQYASKDIFSKSEANSTAPKPKNRLTDGFPTKARSSPFQKR